MPINAVLKHHAYSTLIAIKGIPLWVWPIPALLCLVLYLLRDTSLHYCTAKDIQQIVAPATIGIAALLVLVLRWRNRAFFTLWLTCFVWALFLRELHFRGTGNGFYIAIILLAIWASQKRELLREYLSRKRLAALLATAFLCFLLSKTFDREYWNFLPHAEAWADNAEESLETFGHLMILALVATTLRLTPKP